MKTLTEILNKRTEIETTFLEYYRWNDNYPRFSAEHRINGKANFEGFWIMGDGPGAIVEDKLATVDMELLLNVVISKTEYWQFELQGNAYDLKYYGDYQGYFNTHWKSLRHIGRRLEALMYMELIIMHDYFAKNTEYLKLVNMEEIFSEKQIKKMTIASKKLIRCNDWAIIKK